MSSVITFVVAELFLLGWYFIMSGSNVYGKITPIKLFFLIAIPGMISMIASSLWGLFDGIFVGNILGETAFAALNLAFPLVLINFSLADLIGVYRYYSFISVFVVHRQFT